MKRKIVIINDHAAVNGGQAKVAIQSAAGLADAGHEVVYFAGSGPVSDILDHPLIEVICLDQQDIRSNPSRIGAAVTGIWNREAAMRLKTFLDGCDPRNTIVHCHGFAKLLSGSIGSVITRHPVPHVFTMHEYSLACPNAGFFDFPAKEICTRKPLGTACLTRNCDSRRAIHKAWRVARQVAVNTIGNMPRGLKDIIYISETQRRAMAPYLGRARLHPLSNPVDAIKTDPVRVEDNDAFILIGRMSPEKGCVLFAEAARMAGVPAIFVGDGEEKEAVLAANPDAIVTGWQSPEEVRGWLERARAIVFSSLWYECQPLVPLEALARGVPTITGRWSAGAESVVDGETGVHMQRQEPQELAAIMRDFTREKARRLGSNAYDAFWSDPLTLDRHIGGLERIYDRVMAVQRPS